MAAERFTFPDEQGKDGPNAKKADDLDIQITDDTPLEDRGRSPIPKEMVEELENDDLEEYSEKVKKRISQARKVYHDERRAKEAAQREKDEALRFAQTKLQENEELKKKLTQGEKVFISEVTAAAKTNLEHARIKLKQAYESGDAELISQATEDFTEAKLKAQEVDKFKPTPLQEEQSGVQNGSQAPRTQAPAPVVDPKATAWTKENTWFGTNKKMTSYALGLHDELVEEGIDPTSDAYYKRIDADMRKRFPENFPESTTQDEDSPPPRKAATVVAPATRSTAPRRVTLTASQVAIAKRLGLSPEQYAREMVKLENQQNG